MHRRFFSVIAAAAILVLLIGSVASAGTVVSNVTLPGSLEVTAAGAGDLNLTLTTFPQTSVRVDRPFNVGLTVAKGTTYPTEGYTTVTLVAQVKDSSEVVLDEGFTFATLGWTNVPDVGWKTQVDLTQLGSEPLPVDFTMTATGTGTFTVSFWLEETS